MSRAVCEFSIKIEYRFFIFGNKVFKSLADIHGRRKFNEEVDVVNSDVEFVNFESSSVSDLPDEEFTIHSKPVELERGL